MQIHGKTITEELVCEQYTILCAILELFDTKMILAFEAIWERKRYTYYSQISGSQALDRITAYSLHRSLAWEVMLSERVL